MFWTLPNWNCHNFVFGKEVSLADPWRQFFNWTETLSMHVSYVINCFRVLELTWVKLSWLHLAITCCSQLNAFLLSTGIVLFGKIPAMACDKVIIIMLNLRCLFPVGCYLTVYFIVNIKTGKEWFVLLYYCQWLSYSAITNVFFYLVVGIWSNCSTYFCCCKCLLNIIWCSLDILFLISQFEATITLLMGYLPVQATIGANSRSELKCIGIIYCFCVKCENTFLTDF